MRSKSVRFLNTKLRRAREERGWTQAEVAEQIGADTKSVNRWELGLRNPTHYYQRQLKELFGMSLTDLGFLTEENPLAGPVNETSTIVWHVPYDQNTYFTDDNHRVEHLRSLFVSEAKGGFRVAISGLGGIGKTQLALEYAHRYRDSYQAVFWVRANSQTFLHKDFAQIACVLQVPEAGKREPKQQYLFNESLHWLRNHNGWLLILDNVEEAFDEGDVKIDSLLSTLKTGHILLTTRAQSVANVAQNFLLESMLPEEGAKFLLYRSHLVSSPDSLRMIEKSQNEEALLLSGLFGGLPLALEQAAAYIQETKCGLASYRQIYEESRKDVLQSKVTYKRLYTDYSESVATTWLISFRHVKQQSMMASDLLNLFAYLAPDAIPEDLILKGAEKLECELHQLAGNRYLFNVACQVLLNYSLLKRFAEGTLLSIHRLVQAVLQDRMDDKDQQFWAKQSLLATEHSFLLSEGKKVELHIPHAQICASLKKKYHLRGQEAAYLLKMTAKAVDAHGWYKQAQPLYEQAFEAYVDLFGLNSAHTIDLFFDVIHIAMDTGKSYFAANIYKKLKEDIELIWGTSHPELLSFLNNAAWAQLCAKEFEDASQTAIQALQLLRAMPDVNLVEQARTYQIAAEVATFLGQRDIAKQFYQSALQFFEQTLGSEHDEVATTLLNFGAFYLNQGDFEQGEPLLQRARDIRLHNLGADHPDVADCLVPLAVVDWKYKRYRAAEEAYRSALTIRQQKLGPDHPDTLQALRNLANLLADQKRDEEAEDYFLQALAIVSLADENILEEYGFLLADYSKFLHRRGRVNEAIVFEERLQRLH